MISARADNVLIDVVVFLAMVAEFEGPPLSFLGSWYRAADGLVDERTRAFKITPELGHELLQLAVRRALDRLSNACTLWWRSRRARCLTVDVARELCMFLSVATDELAMWPESKQYRHRHVYHQECRPSLVRGPGEISVRLDIFGIHLSH